MPERMRELFEQRLKYLRKMRRTHIEIEVGEEFCLVFRDPSLPPDNEVCQHCRDDAYLALPRKGAQWLAAGNSKRNRAEEKQSPIDHLATPYAHVSAMIHCPCSCKVVLLTNRQTAGAPKPRALARQYMADLEDTLHQDVMRV